MVVIESDAEVLGHYGFTMALLVDHDPHELTTIMVKLTTTIVDGGLL